MKLEHVGKYNIAGRGTVFVIKNPIECTNFKWLIGKDIEIDNQIWHVSAVEHFLTYTHPVGQEISVRLVGPAKQ